MLIYRERQVLLNNLDLRVVINGHHIYPLFIAQPVMVRIEAPDVTIVVTDGFHITATLQVPFHDGNACRLSVGCTLNDEQLFSGLLLTIILYVAAIIAQVLFLKALCFLPLLLGLYQYYFRRQRFLQVRMAATDTSA